MGIFSDVCNYFSYTTKLVYNIKMPLWYVRKNVIVSQFYKFYPSCLRAMFVYPLCLRAMFVAKTTLIIFKKIKMFKPNRTKYISFI